MKYYKHSATNEIFAYDSESEKILFGSPELVEISNEEFDALVKSNISISSPSFVSRAQGKAALIRSGLWQGVVDFVNSIEDATEKAVAEVALNDTTHWQRSSPFLNSAAEALVLTDEQLDQLFIDASKIEL